MVDRSDLIAASVYSQKLSRDFSSNSSLRERRGSEVPWLQNRSCCPHHSLGLSCAKVRPLLPRTGHGSARPSTEASGPPAVDASGTTTVDVLGLSLAKVTGLQSPTSATTAALSSWPRTRRPGRRRLNHPDIGSDGRLRGRISDGSGRSRCRRRQHVRRARGRGRDSNLSRHDGCPNRGVSLGGLPHVNPCRMGPRRRAPCAEANQPAWRAAAQAPEAGPVLRAFVGAGTAKPCLRLLKEREREQVQDTQ
jgi:hypothetical protein